MNERIRELYRQRHTDGFFGMAFDPEKFAELIIKECYDVVMTGDRYRRDYFAEKILIHFGMSKYDSTAD